MLQNSRALRRASDVASARAAVTGRRPMTILGIVAGVVLGAAVTVGAVSIPAAGLADAGTAAAAPARMTAASAPLASGAPIAPGAMPLSAIADEATQVFEEAKGAVAAAETLNAEVADSGLDVDAGNAELDASTVKDRIGTLEDRELLPALLLPPLTSRVASATSALLADTAVLREAFTAAREKKAAEDAARAEAERAAAEAAALASANTVDGAKATARELAASRYGWGAEQFSCLDSLWTKESGWNYRAYNPSGATGIPQALPGGKMASAGGDWQTNAATQISWGLGYISSVYGTPCGAWAKSQAVNWY